MQSEDRKDQFKVYQHIMGFCSSDLDDTLDFEEKQKKRREHAALLARLEDRPEDFKLKKFLAYEKCNLKSNLYNKAFKLDAIFKELSAAPTRPLKNEWG